MPPQLEGKAVSIMNQPNRGKGGGRKPKLPKKWLKPCKLSKKDAQIILQNLFEGNTLAQLDDLMKSEYDQVSAMTYAFITGAIAAARKGDFRTTKEIVEFIWGKDDTPPAAAQNTQIVDLKVLILNQANASPEERERIIEQLEQITGYQE
jgi:hypothetical protein